MVGGVFDQLIQKGGKVGGVFDQLIEKGAGLRYRCDLRGCQ
jgi:hypothetical protein